MRATVGSIVHYHSYGTPGGEFASCPRAAIVAEVHVDDEVTVCAISPSGIFFSRVKYSEEPQPGCWGWPQMARPC